MGVVLVALLASAFFFLRKPKASKSPESGFSSDYNRSGKDIEGKDVMEAIFDYQANLFDELTLSMKY